MFYYVEITGDKIISKGFLSEKIELSNGFKEVPEDIYNEIGVMPCSFIEKNGQIVSVDYIEPTPSPTPPKTPTSEERLQALEDAMLALTLGGM